MAYQAIHTTYYGSTNLRPARVRALAANGKRFYHWDHNLNVEENHRAAAREFAKEFGWTGKWAAGGSADGKGFVFVNLTDHVVDSFEVEAGGK